MLRQPKIKFVCINMLIVTSLLAVVFGLVLHFTSRNMTFQNERMLQQLHQMQLHKAPLEPDMRIPFFMVQISRQGTITVSSASFFNHTKEEQLVDIAEIAYNREYANGVLKEYELQYSRQTTPFGKRIVFIDVSRDRVIMQDLLETCGIIGLISLSLFLAISVAFAQWAVKPVAEAWKQQKQFVADASHELKTPLTVILTNAELLGSDRYDAVSKAQFVQSIYAMSLQMRGLVESLLDLARLDNGAAKITLSELNFSAVAESCLHPFEPMFFEEELYLESDIAGDIMVRASESHLRQVLDILLDNALKYSTRGTVVSVSLCQQGNNCIFSISGRGDTLSRDDLKNIFKRFYRLDKARTMNHSYGLGLPIAQSIVQEHNGKIWAESENGSNTFRVQLPILR